MADFKKLQAQLKDAGLKATVVAKDTAEKTKDLAGKGVEKASEVKLSTTCTNCGTKVSLTLGQAKANEVIKCTNPECGAEIKTRDEAMDKAKGLQEPIKKTLPKVTKYIKR